MFIRIVFSLTLVLATAAAGFGQPIVLTGGRLYKDQDAFIDRSVVVINSGKIFIVGSADRRLSRVNFGGQYSNQDPYVIDVEGKFIAHGMQSVYLNLDRDSGDLTKSLRALGEILKWGTTGVVVSMKSPSLLQVLGRQLDEARTSFPETALVGELNPETEAVPILTRTSMSPLRLLKEFADSGAAAVHLRLVPDSTNVEAGARLREVVARARELQVAVWVHTERLAVARDAVEAGAVGLTSGISDEPVDEAFLALLRENGVFYLSPLAPVETQIDPAKLEEQTRIWGEKTHSKPTSSARLTPETHEARRTMLRDNLRRIYLSGVPVAFGVDLAATGSVAGLSTHIEQSLAAEAGLSAADIFKLSHTDATGLIGASQASGVILPSTPANLVVLDEDPLETPDNLQSIRWVIRLGEIHDPPRPVFREKQ